MNCPTSSRTIFAPTPYGGSGGILGFGPKSLVPSISEASQAGGIRRERAGNSGGTSGIPKQGCIPPSPRHRQSGGVETPGAKALRHRHRTESQALKLAGLLRPSAHHDARRRAAAALRGGELLPDPAG